MAVLTASPAAADDCPCGCGRVLQSRRQKSATAACRKRLQLQRDEPREVFHGSADAVRDFAAA